VFLAMTLPGGRAGCETLANLDIRTRSIPEAAAPAEGDARLSVAWRSMTITRSVRERVLLKDGAVLGSGPGDVLNGA